MKPIVILDNGHGGMIAGKYTTDPKTGKFFVHPDGTTIHEGEFNRQVKNRVMERLYNLGIPYFDLVPEQEDIAPALRTERANRFHAMNYSAGQGTFLISIHSDAGGGTGAGTFVHLTHSNAAMDLAKIAENIFVEHFPEAKHRGIKKQNLFICRDTIMPAILLENFFMDNLAECKKYLKDPHGRDRIADYIVDIIVKFRDLYER